MSGSYIRIRPRHLRTIDENREYIDSDSSDSLLNRVPDHDEGISRSQNNMVPIIIHSPITTERNSPRTTNHTTMTNYRRNAHSLDMNMRNNQAVVTTIVWTRFDRFLLLISCFILFFILVMALILYFV